MAGIPTSKVQRARLELNGVSTTIVANVAHRGPYRMTVEQPLPFLALDSEVRDEDGRTAQIAGVQLELRDGVPLLVLELAYDDTQQPAPPTEASVARHAAHPAPVNRIEATMPYAVEAPAQRTELAVGRLALHRPWWHGLLARFLGWWNTRRGRAVVHAR